MMCDASWMMGERRKEHASGLSDAVFFVVGQRLGAAVTGSVDYGMERPRQLVWYTVVDLI